VRAGPFEAVRTVWARSRRRRRKKSKDYYVRERSFDSFERTFPVPDGVDLDKVDASFKKGVLTVTLPKTAEDQKAEKKIILAEQLGRRSPAEKDTRSNECYTKKLEALPSRRKQQPLLPHRRLRLSGDRLRQTD
jgi:Hsp20/alpha crystallin family